MTGEREEFTCSSVKCSSLVAEAMTVCMRALMPAFLFGQSRLDSLARMKDGCCGSCWRVALPFPLGAERDRSAGCRTSLPFSDDSRVALSV